MGLDLFETSFTDTTNDCRIIDKPEDGGTLHTHAVTHTVIDGIPRDEVDLASIDDDREVSHERDHMTV